jgi:hypothetical protein
MTALGSLGAKYNRHHTPSAFKIFASGRYSQSSLDQRLDIRCQRSDIRDWIQDARCLLCCWFQALLPLRVDFFRLLDFLLDEVGFGGVGEVLGGNDGFGRKLTRVG